MFAALRHRSLLRLSSSSILRNPTATATTTTLTFTPRLLSTTALQQAYQQREGGFSRGGGGRGRGGSSFGRSSDRGRSPGGGAFTNPSKYEADLSDHEAIAEDSEHAVNVTESEEANEPTKFQDLADRKMIDPLIISTITNKMKFEDMTKVQRKTITSTLAGEDVLAQAKTGTGKTIAFLLPVLQRMLDSPDPIQRRKVDIRCVIISPTRELALQILRDAERLTQGTKISCQAAVGGTGKSQAVREMRTQGCHLLVATPGRLADLMTDEYQPLDMSHVDTLVLDEGDTLLDQGFSIAINKIVQKLPASEDGPRGRQSLIFSATMPEKVLQMVRQTLKRSYKFLKMVERGEAAVHERVTQHYVEAAGYENLLPALWELVDRERQLTSDFKAIIFFQTTKFAKLGAATFRGATTKSDPHKGPLDLFITEIHSRLTQSARTRTADNFRRVPRGILFASDVVARGMDFPGVTHVIQIGAPSSKEQYIHRLGRTARGEHATGTGYLMVTSAEAQYGNIRGLTTGLNILHNEHGLTTPTLAMDTESTVPTAAAEALSRITAGSTRVNQLDKDGTYLSFLGYNASWRSRQGVIDALNQWSKLGWGMEKPPHVGPMFVRKLGYDRVQGLNTQNPPPRQDETGVSAPMRGERRFNDDRAGFGSRRQYGDDGGRDPNRAFSGPSRPSSGPGGKQPWMGRGRVGNRGGDESGYNSGGGRYTRGGGGGGGARGSGMRNDRPSYGDRGSDRPSYGDRGSDRPSYGDRGSDRPSYGDRGSDRPSYGDRGSDRPSYGDRGSDRPSYGDRGRDRPSFGDRGSSGRGGGFGGGRGGFRGGRERQVERAY